MFFNRIFRIIALLGTNTKHLKKNLTSSDISRESTWEISLDRLTKISNVELKFHCGVGLVMEEVSSL